MVLVNPALRVTEIESSRGRSKSCSSDRKQEGGQ